MHHNIDGHPIDRGHAHPAGPLVLALDQGTTNAKAVLFDAERRVVASASRPVDVQFPHPGWVEQDAEQIWAATLTAAVECLARGGSPRIAGIAISTQRESAVAWSARTGRPVGPVLGWQDARTTGRCIELRGQDGEFVSRRTGLTIDPMYSAPKMRWLLDSAVDGGMDVADLRLGTIDSWLCWNLAGELLAEAGNASRTLLFDLETLTWNEDLLGIFGIPAGSLAPIARSDGGFGATSGASGLPAGVPLLAVMADSHAAMFAQGCTSPGQAKATYGTGSSVMTPALDAVAHRPVGLATTLGWLRQAPVYAYEGNIVASGAALDWMCRTLGLHNAAELSELAASAPSSEGVSFVPAFTGLGAPYWDRSATAVLTGITAASSRAHLARAAIDAVAHQVADVVEAVDAGGQVPIAVLAADGGATASHVLMQAQADLLGRPVRVSGVAEASALGAAMLAFETLGIPQATAGHGPAEIHLPDLPEDDRLGRRRSWATAIARARLASDQ